MHIIFNTLKIKNFLSVGEEVLELDFKSGINLITGTNTDNNTRNGVGKSSIIESIYWCLFGKTIRDIKNEKIIHNQQKKGCAVELSFNLKKDDLTQHKYTIIRSLGPSKIEILKDDKDITLSTIPSNDKEIEKIIGATPELFNNAIIMTADNTLPFMAQKKIDKRKFIEGILNLNIFTEMLLKARSDFNETKKENDILCNSFVNEQKNLETFEYHIQKNIEKKNNKISSLENDIVRINEQICSYQETNTPIEDIVKKIETTEEKIKKLESALENLDKTFIEDKEVQIQIKTKRQNLIDDIKKLKDKKEFCPTCNRKFEDHDGELIKSKIGEIEDQIKELETDYNEISKEVDTKTNKKTEIKTFISSLKDKNRKLLIDKGTQELKDQKIKDLSSKIKDIEKQINDIKNEKDETADEIEKIKNNIKTLEDKLTLAKKNLAILDEVKFVLSEEGVKTYIIKKLLTVFNQKLNYYLKLLDAPCTCEFDEFFDEKILNIEGKECSYFNFSGGERKRIDVATLFTFQDVLRTYTGNSYSLSMYDELFDSAIDESGIDKIVEILKRRIEENQEMIYVVSHNKTSIKNNFDDIITLKKSNGKTIIAS